MARVIESIAPGRLKPREVAPGVLALELSNRITRSIGLVSTPYLIGQILVDTSFAHVGSLLDRFVADRVIGAVCCTHHHEDHVGNAGLIAQRHGCPVYLRCCEARNTEGVSRLPPYRALFWGAPHPFAPEELPATISRGGRTLHAVPTPGHSGTHTVLFEQETGLLFSGDLYLSPGVSAMVAHENPYEIARSLRRAADLRPTTLLTGHGGVVDDAERRLRQKAQQIEAACEQVRALRAKGMRTADIARRVFPSGRRRALWVAAISCGEYSRASFVRASIACAR